MPGSGFYLNPTACSISLSSAAFTLADTFLMMVSLSLPSWCQFFVLFTRMHSSPFCCVRSEATTSLIT